MLIVTVNDHQATMNFIAASMVMFFVCCGLLGIIHDINKTRRDRKKERERIQKIVDGHNRRYRR